MRSIGRQSVPPRSRAGARFCLFGTLTLLLVSVWAGLPAAANSYLHAEGPYIVDANGQRVLLQGTNLGGWLYQGYGEFGYYPNDKNYGYFLEALERRFGPAQANSIRILGEEKFIREIDIQFLHELGYNLVRVPFAWRELMNNDGTYRTKADGSIDFGKLDWIVAMAEKYKMYVIFDLHTWPRQGSNYNSPNDGSTIDGPPLPDGSPNPMNIGDLMSNLWGTLARHFQGKTAVAAFDLMNEPNYCDPWYYQTFLKVRIQDPDRMIILEETSYEQLSINPTNGGKLDKDITPYTNVVFSRHWYDFNSPTYNSAPGESKSVQHVFTYGNRPLADLTKNPSMFHEWIRNHHFFNAPTYIGETKLPATDDKNRVSLSTFIKQSTWSISQWQSLGWAWTPWTYKTEWWQGDNGLVNMAKDQDNTPGITKADGKRYNLDTDSLATITANINKYYAVDPCIFVNGIMVPTGYARYQDALSVLSPKLFAYPKSAAGIGQEILTKTPGTILSTPSGQAIKDACELLKAWMVFAQPVNDGSFYYNGGTLSQAFLQALVANKSADELQTLDLDLGINAGLLATIKHILTTTEFADIQSLSGGNGLTVPGLQAYAEQTLAASQLVDVDIGSPAQVGSAFFDGTRFFVNGGGNDIWNSSDQFNFDRLPLSENSAALVVQVIDVSQTNDYAKAGLMFRSSDAADSPFVGLFQNPNRSVEFIWRDSAGAQADWSGGRVGVGGAAKWLKLLKTGNVYRAYYATTSSPPTDLDWIALGQHTTSLSPTYEAGLAVTAHDNSQSNSSSLTRLSITLGQDLVLPATAAPSSTTLSTLQGSPLKLKLTSGAGAESLTTSTITSQPGHGTITGSGTDLVYTPAPGYNGADSFRIAPLTTTGTPNNDITINLTVAATNTPPTITKPLDTLIDHGNTSPPLNFTVNDLQTASDALTVTAKSSNTLLLPVSNIGLAGTGSTRSVTLTTRSGQTGRATVTLTVSDGVLTTSTNFTVNVPVSALTNQWRQTYFGTIDPIGPASDTADPDSDGIPNLLEFATASDPTRLDSVAPVQVTLVQNHLVINFVRLAPSPVRYTVQASNDLQAWQDIVTLGPGDSTWLPLFGGISVSESGSTPTRRTTITDPVDVTAPQAPKRRFLRLSITP